MIMDGSPFPTVGESLCPTPRPRHRSCYHCIYSFPSYKRDHTERSPCHSGVCAFCIAEYYPIVRTSTVCPSGLLSGLGSVPNFVHSGLSFNEHLPKSRSFLLSAERGLGWQNACKMQDRRLRNSGFPKWLSLSTRPTQAAGRRHPL